MRVTLMCETGCMQPSMRETLMHEPWWVQPPCMQPSMRETLVHEPS